jgi:hypothetical protein
MILKHLAELGGIEEEANLHLQLLKWCKSFDEATCCIPTWLSLEASKINFLTLMNAIERIVEVTAHFWIPGVARKHEELLHHARKQLEQIKTRCEPTLFAYLRHVDDNDLLVHYRDQANLHRAQRDLSTQNADLHRELQVLSKDIAPKIITAMERQLRPVD